MKGFWLTLLFLVVMLLAVSCKSTKKTIGEVSRTEQESVDTIIREINTDLGKVTKKTVVTQVVNEKYELVPGTNEVQPTKTTTITTEVEEIESKRTTNKKAIEVTAIDAESFDSLALDRETEGMEVVEEIVGGITGAFIGDITKYIIGTIFFVILIIVVTRLLKKRD
jgi:LAS superfamily LD-carboxypeptidase LdcB